tara:strand:+ start:93 stop:401 length:309 start_codon:yes stop_codon:yes gene_type:complete
MIVRVSNPNKNHLREREEKERHVFDIFSLPRIFLLCYSRYSFLINTKKRKRIYDEEEDEDENDLFLSFLFVFFLGVRILSRGGFLKFHSHVSSLLKMSQWSK